MNKRKRPTLKESFIKVEEQKNCFKRNYNNRCYNKTKQQGKSKRPELKQENSSRELHLDLSFFTQGLMLM